MKKIDQKIPTISVIMAVYNAQSYLKEAINSILSQSFHNFEFIIIDDGSTDSSLKIIKNFSVIDSRIKIITRENRGLISSLNEGISLAKGIYIARMDADDISYPHRLEEQLQHIESMNLDICGGDYNSIDQYGKFLYENIMPKNNTEILLTMASNVPFAHPSVMISKAFIHKNNLTYGMDGHKNAEDLDLWIKIYNAGGKFGNLNKKILDYRILPFSLSRVTHSKIKKEANEQFNNFVRIHNDKFSKALNEFCELNNKSRAMERIAAKALMRSLFISFDKSLVYKCFNNLKLSNLILGFFSFIKSNYF
jgi:glycosyltransferase involved in cell wall biosynthesis